MTELLIPGLILGGFALVSSTGLYFAAQKFYVQEDPRIGEIGGYLPGANCGGCGFAGCANYAEHVVQEISLDITCPVADAESMSRIARILGIEANNTEKRVASLMCQGTHDKTAEIMDYRGITDCWAFMLVADSSKACAFSCLGLGSCVAACPFGAMEIRDGIVQIDEKFCTGCGLCIDTCPKNILHLRPLHKRITVTCHNTDKGVEAKNACISACIACMKCQKACTYDAISIDGFLAKIDYEKCNNCGACVDVCPTNAILDLGKVYDA